MPLKPGSHLKVGEFLAVGDYIQSPNRCFHAIMQSDGNFCVYRGQDPDHQYKVLWAHNKLKPSGKFYAIMQEDGNFVVYKGSGPGDRQEVVWAIWDHGVPPGKFYANMQDDGNFAVYKGTGPDKSGECTWDTHVMDHPKGVGLDGKSTIEYHLDKAKTLSQGETSLYRQTVRNNSPIDQTSEISGSETVTEEFGWSNSLGGEHWCIDRVQVWRSTSRRRESGGFRRSVL